MNEITFINERGNKITVRVRDLTKYSRGVIIDVIGPRSRIESILTDYEARRLRDMLVKELQE